MKVSDENRRIRIQDPDPDPSVIGMDPRIRIRINPKMSWIRNTAFRKCLAAMQEKCNAYSGLQKTIFLSATQETIGCRYILQAGNELPARKQNMTVCNAENGELHAMQKMPDCCHAEIKCAGNANVLSRKCCSKVDRGGNLVTRGLYFAHNGLVESFF